MPVKNIAWSRSQTETPANRWGRLVDCLGEDLQDNVFTALRVLGEGFLASNDLDIDPSDSDKLDELKEQSLVLLYRLMFVLYAESRGLISPDNPDGAEEFDAHFSLDQVRRDSHEEVTEGKDLTRIANMRPASGGGLKTRLSWSTQVKRRWGSRRTMVGSSIKRATSSSLTTK